MTECPSVMYIVPRCGTAYFTIRVLHSNAPRLLRLLRCIGRIKFIFISYTYTLHCYNILARCVVLVYLCIANILLYYIAYLKSNNATTSRTGNNRKKIIIIIKYMRYRRKNKILHDITTVIIQ